MYDHDHEPQTSGECERVNERARSHVNVQRLDGLDERASYVIWSVN